MKKLITLFLLLIVCAAGNAQRVTDKLDRGLVAVVPRNGSGIFVSWRILANEYFGVKYNLYRNGTKIASNLSVSNYMDASGSSINVYTVKAVVDGVEQAASKPAKVFATAPYTQNGTAGAPAYLNIPMKDVVDRNGNVIYSADGTICTWNYTLNDACLADLDGDGEIEIIVKRINQTDASSSYPDGTAKQLYETSNTTAYTIFEAYKLDGTRLWWIDCGPNMVSLNSTEINCVAYDWDEDGKAEVIMRGADNMIIHMADGTSYNVGNMSVNTRNDLSSHTDSQYAWTKTGAEYLLYLNGETANPYSVTTFPLERLVGSETLAQAWTEGDASKAYGHRSSKYFFGAPVLDGRHASIFLARGIYTRTKMVALDVNRNTHALTQCWYLDSNSKGSIWYGQGNHNMTIADVDGDGCDEIIYGSMTIDHNGKGLSSTGLGHGDAMHVSDLDPFTKGMEVFACNEEKPGNNYRNATTSEVYYRKTASADDGRALMGNFSNNVPGCLGRSVSSGVVSSVTHNLVDLYVAPDDFISWGWLNGRIYWDGDLCEEYVNSPGTERDLVVAKVGTGRVMQTSGVALTNDSKNNPCAQGDIIGDWREELIVRSSDNKNLRIYSTDVPTTWRIPSLWFDHEYRQAMVWQVCGYNQPPHCSFFLGEIEGITEAPVPLTMEGRTEIEASSVISSSLNGKDIFYQGGGNIGLNSSGSAPRNLFLNVPSDVRGSSSMSGGNGSISYSYSQLQLGANSDKGDLTGSMNLVKQGDGLLKMTARTFNYTGKTQLWAGTLYFRGTFENSDVWMNRHTEFFSGANIKKSLTMEYGSALRPSLNAVSASTVEYGTTTVGTLNMHEGSRIVFQMDVVGGQSDKINLTNLNIRKQNWQYGPEYLAPVFEIQAGDGYKFGIGTYSLGTINGEITGSLDDIIIEGVEVAAGTQDPTVSLMRDDEELLLVVGGVEVSETTPVEVWKLDFEEASSNNYGFSVSSSAAQYEISANSHCFHVWNDASGDRSANITFGDNLFSSELNYCFEFDWGGASSNQNVSETTVLTNNSQVLFKIILPSYSTTARVLDASDNEIGTVRTLSGSYVCPVSAINHFKIESDQTATYLTVTGASDISRTKISTSFKNVRGINNKLGRAYSHMLLDNISLTFYNTELSDQKQMQHTAGKYNEVTVLRSLVAGYNSFAIPMQTTAEAVAGAGAKAYELAEAVDLGGSNYALRFTEVETIEPNMPYILYAREAIDVPDFTEATLVTATPESKTVDGWTFTSNYFPHFNTAGKYVVVNGELRLCGPNGYVNGMRGYFTAPSASVNATIMFKDFDGTTNVLGSPTDDDPVVAIKTLGGIEVTALQSGINILIHKSGKTTKIYHK